MSNNVPEICWQTVIHKFCILRGGEGVKISKYFVDVIYGIPLIALTSIQLSELHASMRRQCSTSRSERCGAAVAPLIRHLHLSVLDDGSSCDSCHKPLHWISPTMFAIINEQIENWNVCFVFCCFIFEMHSCSWTWTRSRIKTVFIDLILSYTDFMGSHKYVSKWTYVKEMRGLKSTKAIIIRWRKSGEFGRVLNRVTPKEKALLPNETFTFQFTEPFILTSCDDRGAEIQSRNRRTESQTSTSADFRGKWRNFREAIKQTLLLTSFPI